MLSIINKTSSSGVSRGAWGVIREVFGGGVNKESRLRNSGGRRPPSAGG